MIQRNAWALVRMVFATLSLSLVAAPSFAQLIEIEDPQANAEEIGEEIGQEIAVEDNQRQDQVEMVDQNGNVIVPAPAPAPAPVQAMAPQALTSRPVTISASMAPQSVPQVQLPAASYRQQPRYEQAPRYDYDTGVGNDGLKVSGPNTGIGGSNPGNANTGGVQVQSVTVTASQDQDQRSDNNASLMKRVRINKEYETNQVAIDRIEQDRLEVEHRRRGSVEGAFSGMHSDRIETHYVTPPLTAPVIIAQNAPQPVPYYYQNVATRGRRHSGSVFKLVPFAGYRWFENNTAEYSARNLGFGGLALEGSISRYFAVEGSASIGRDDFTYRGPNNGFNNGFNAGFNNGFNAGYNPDLYVARSRTSYEVAGAIKLGFTVNKVRPYILGGLGGLLQRYNIDNTVTIQQLEQVGLQRSTSNLTGNFGGGLDIAMSNNLALGGRFDYQGLINRKFTEMHRIYGDVKHRYRVQGSVQLIF